MSEHVKLKRTKVVASGIKKLRSEEVQQFILRKR